nr:hypothetical protein [Brevibacterium limosum]
MNVDADSGVGNDLIHRGSFVAHPSEPLGEDEVERVGDLQCFFVTVDSDDVDAESLDQARIVRRCSTAHFLSTSVRKLLIGLQKHLGAEPLRRLDPSQLGPVEIAAHHCTRAGALNRSRIWMVWSIRGDLSAGITADRPDNSFRSAISGLACPCARIRSNGPVRNDTPYGIDHRQDRDDSLGAGVQRGDHSCEDIGRGQTPRRIMDEDEFRITAMFQGCLH